MDPEHGDGVGGRIGVAVVDHMRTHRDGVALAVTHDPRLELVAEAATVHDLTDATLARLRGMILQAAGPGVDLRTAIVRARMTAPTCTIVVVMPWVDEAVVGWLAAAGVDIVMTTDTPLAEVLTALALGHVGASLNNTDHAEVRAQAIALRLKITPRELDILRRLSAGTPPQRIAYELGRSVDTVRDHIGSVRRKLGCANTVELVVTAYRHGLLPSLSLPVEVGAGDPPIRG